MKKNIFGHIQVFGEVGIFYNENTAKFVGFPKLIATFGKVADRRQLLLDLGVIQGRNNKGLTSNKKLCKQELANEILFNAGAAAGHYFDVNDMDMFNNFDFPEKSFSKLRPEVMLQDSDRVVKLLTDNIGDLTGTGVTIISIAKIETAKDKFIAIMGVPIITRKAKSLVTKQISAVDKETFKIIRKELSNEMKVFLTSDPVLFNKFKKVIEITSEGAHTHRAPKVITAPVVVTAIHHLTEEPLVGISGKFVGNKTTFTTDVNGTFIAALPLGAGLGKLVGVDFVAQSFAFTLTAEGYTIIIRMIPTGI